jgi:hypothetical protein
MLKIVRPWVAPPPPFGAAYTINEGYRDACQSMGIELIEWQTHLQTLEEICEVHQPDIFFFDCGQRFELPPYIKNHKCKIICGVAQFPLTNNVPIFPDLAEQGYITNKEHVDWIKELNPDVLYHSASKRAIFAGWGGWFDLDYHVMSLPLAGNPHKFYPIVESEKTADVTYIGGFWPYKAQGLFSFVMPCMMYCRTRIVGAGWPFEVSHEYLDSFGCNIAWNQSHIAISVQEPNARWNSSKFCGGELSERVYSAALSGCLVIADCPASIKQIFGSNKRFFPSFDQPDKFHDFVRSTLKNPQNPYIMECRQNQRQVVLNTHCYKHRIQSIFKTLNINYEKLS